MRMHEKLARKRNRFGICGRNLGLLLRDIYIFRKLFSRTVFCILSQILWLYLEPFKSNRGSKLTIVTKSLQKFNVFGIIADTSWGLPPHAIHVQKDLFTRHIYLADSMRLSLVSFTSYKASKMSILRKCSWWATIHFQKALFMSNIHLAVSITLSCTVQKLFSFIVTDNKISTYLAFCGSCMGANPINYTCLESSFHHQHSPRRQQASILNR